MGNAAEKHVTQPVERQYYDTKAAASYLGISPAALRQHVHRGHITPDHLGQRGGGLKSNQFVRTTLDAFMRRAAANDGGEGGAK